MKDLTDLRKIAEAATPGPWRAQEGYFVNTVPEFDLHRFDVMSEEVAECDLRQADATHIATFDPPTVLALITRLEQAEAAVARVRELALESQAEVAQMNMPNIRTLSGEILRALDGDTRG